MDDEERGEMRGKHQKFSILRHDWHNYLSAASCIYDIYIGAGLNKTCLS